MKAADKKAWFQRGSLLQHQAYDNCIQQESKKAKPNNYNCQSSLNAAKYYDGMADSIQRPQLQFSTTQSSEALGVPARALPSSQVGKTLPRMPKNTGSSGFPNFDHGRPR